MTTTLTASNTAQLNAAIQEVNAAAAGAFVINLQGNITLAAALDTIDLQSGVSLIIDGSNGGGTYTLDSADYPALTVTSGVIIENLTIANSASNSSPINAAVAWNTSESTITMGSSNPGWVLPGMIVYDVTTEGRIGTVLSYSGTSLALTANAATPNVSSTDSLRFVMPAATLAGGEIAGTVNISSNAYVVQTGQITFGDSTNGPAIVTNNGTYDITGASGITNGTSGSEFINNGTLERDPNGISGVSYIGVDVIDTGTLSVPDNTPYPGSTTNLRFGGANNSFSGIYVGGGMIDYGNPNDIGSGVDTLSNIDMQDSACTTSWAIVDQSGVMTLSANSTIVVFGEWNFTSDTLATGPTPTGNGLFEEVPSTNPGNSVEIYLQSGTIAKTGGTGTTVIDIPFQPNGGNGDITVNTGTLAFDGFVNNFNGPISGGGTFSIGASTLGGSTDTIYNGTPITTGGWTITGAGTNVTLNEALSYSGNFAEQSGTTLKLTPSDTLTLSGPATFTNATVIGTGTAASDVLATSGNTTIAGLTIANTAQWQNSGTATVTGSASATVSDLTDNGSVTLDSASTLDALDVVGSGQQIDFAANTAVLDIGALSGFAGTIKGFVDGDIIGVSSAIDKATPGIWNAGANTTPLTLTLSGAAVGGLTLAGNYASDSFAVTAASGTYDITTNASCFMRGTMIQTPCGEVAVEALKRGDPILSADGRLMPVTWIGLQTISIRFADPLRVLPIRIKAGALDDDVPRRDLLLSPDHAILFNDVLIQAGALVNGVSIVREKNVPDTFTYYHVEVDDHSLILAENTAAETFVDNVDRLSFDNWQEHMALYPESNPIMEMPYPRAKASRQVPQAIRERLIERAATFIGCSRQAAA